MSIQSVSPQEIARQKEYADQVDHCQTLYRNETGFSRKYFIHTFGCQLNENDSEHIAGLLDQMGYIEANDIREADLIILNTCSVRENADNRLFGNLGMIKNLRKDKPDLLVALCGCMMKQEEHVERVKRSFSFVDIIFGPQDIYRLPELLYHRLNDQRKVYEIGSLDLVAEGYPIHRARKFRALCSIMYGCNNFCTYCVVPYTRGRERSRKAEAILQELQDLAASGYKEVMLLGQNVNSYGHDLDVHENSPADFAGLLAAAAQIEGLRRIRFMTSHPKDISENLLQTMAEYPVIEPHLHLPLQSGSDRILALMNRHYTRDQFMKITARARQLIPGLSISTDLIVGFPGESAQDFEDTLDLMDFVRFDSAFTFQFSKRTGTPAATMPDQIPPEIVKERFGRLITLQNRHSLASNEQVIGQSAEILIEGASNTADQILSGRTASNRLVNFTVSSPESLPKQYLRQDGQVDGKSLEGCLAMVKLERAKTFSIEGKMERLLL